MRNSLAAAVLVSCLSVSCLTAPVSAQLTIRHELSAEYRQALATAVLSACAADGAQVAVAVADREGTVRTLVSGEDVSAFSIEAARGKAETAARLRRDTSVLVDTARNAPDFAALLANAQPPLTLLSGGVAIRRGDEFLGAVGVGGGGRQGKDEECAKAGIAAVAEKLR